MSHELRRRTLEFAAVIGGEVGQVEGLPIVEVLFAVEHGGDVAADRRFAAVG